ncbi:MAG: mechanosensitive ion channel family protein [Bryobacteraceae bacterium]|jgi:small-conductance mechanosensitive channel
MRALDWLAANPRTWIEPAIVFAAAIMAALLARHLLLRALRSWNARARSRAGTILYEALRVPTLIWIVILAAHVAIQSSQLPEAAVRLAPKALEALWIVSFTLMCARIAGDLVRNYGAGVAGAMPVTSLTENLARIGVLILGLLPLLRILGVEIAPILTALGVGGLAVALALQDTLSNLFAGFYVAVAGQVRLGDYIKLNTGEEGYVADISWRSTSVRALANNLIIVPNAKLAQAIVTNYHLPEKRMASSVQVGVSYAADPNHVERVLMDVAARGVHEIPGMLAEPAPAAAFDPGFGESALGFTLNYQVEEFASQYGVRNELRKRILRRFREEGIEIPFPTRTVHLDAAAPGEPKPGPATL